MAEQPFVEPEWLQIARRAKTVLNGNHGYALVTLRILVGPNQKPFMWAEPKMTRIEPRGLSEDALMNLLANLTE